VNPVTATGNDGAPAADPLIAVVGGGMAGISAARTLRELGFTGELTVFGAEAIEPYERPALSKSFLTEHDSAAPPLLHDGEMLRQAGIRLRLDTTVAAIDPARRRLTTGGGEHLRYTRLLLATGSRCRRLDIPGGDLHGVRYLRELTDAHRLRQLLQPGRRIVVVGGGVIGLEVAASAVHRGCRVTVVEAGPQLMGRVVPFALATAVADLHRARGVRILTGVAPQAFIGGTDGVRGVALADGRVLAADAVVVGIGAVPRTELAERAGLTVEDGVIVDEQFRSSDENIFAAGDVARVFHAGARGHLRSESWRLAETQGRQAAASILGRGEPYRDIPWMWSDQHEAHIQTIGFGFRDAELISHGSLEDRAGLSYFAVRDQRIVAAAGVSLGSGVGKTIRAAQLLMERGSRVEPDRLRDQTHDLKALLRGAARHPPTAHTSHDNPSTDGRAAVLPSRGM
jgi:3-phenylpropionate/trans-cinnamate dioxygenase ferredoxin reductase component